MNAYERRRQLACLKRAAREADKRFKLQLREHRILRAYEVAHKELYGYEPTITKSLWGGWYTVEESRMRLNDFPKATSLLYAKHHERGLYHAAEA
jgi:hypothetical protein